MSEPTDSSVDPQAAPADAQPSPPADRPNSPAPSQPNLTVESGSFIMNGDSLHLEKGFPVYVDQVDDPTARWPVTPEGYRGTIGNLREVRTENEELKAKIKELETSQSQAAGGDANLIADLAKRDETIESLKEQLQRQGAEFEQFKTERDREDWLKTQAVFGDGPGTFRSGVRGFSLSFGDRVQTDSKGDHFFVNKKGEPIRSGDGNYASADMAVMYIATEAGGADWAKDQFRSSKPGGSGGVNDATSATGSSELDQLLVEHAGKSRNQIPSPVRQRIAGLASTSRDARQSVIGAIPGFYGG